MSYKISQRHSQCPAMFEMRMIILKICQKKYNQNRVKTPELKEKFNEYRRNLYHKNPEKYIKYQCDYMKRHPEQKEKKRIRGIERYWENVDSICEYQREYYNENKEKRKESYKEWVSKPENRAKRVKHQQEYLKRKCQRKELAYQYLNTLYSAKGNATSTTDNFSVHLLD